MELENLKDASEQVSFSEAVKKGLGKNQGLFFPKELPKFDDIDSILGMPFVERSVEILSTLIGDELPREMIAGIVERAFVFGAPLAQVTDNIYSLELFHGPTLAFKDFGGRFMAQCLVEISDGQPITILTATSGDTGAAVAHAFHGIENINVVILYPKGKISLLQEKLFTTLGGNIHTAAIEDDFDACQQLVKSAFDDPEVRDGLHLNSANSINIARLIPQSFYYMHSYMQLKDKSIPTVCSVPCGNFGNITAGLIAKKMGVPIDQFIASTNLNDVVPKYFETGNYDPKPSIQTISNAMDVGNPSNMARIMNMYANINDLKNDMVSWSFNEQETSNMISHIEDKYNYLIDPHSSVGILGLLKYINMQNTRMNNIFLGTAHPGKFADVIEPVINKEVELPDRLKKVLKKEKHSIPLKNDFEEFNDFLLRTFR